LRLFGTKRDELTGEWRKLPSEELNDLYSLPNSVWVIKIEKKWMDGTCSAYWGVERCIQDFGGEICGKETAGETQA
jgi:hypothetical protein